MTFRIHLFQFGALSSNFYAAFLRFAFEWFSRTWKQIVIMSSRLADSTYFYLFLVGLVISHFNFVGFFSKESRTP